MQRILKAHCDGRFAVIPAQAGIQTGPRIGVRGDGVIPHSDKNFGNCYRLQTKKGYRLAPVTSQILW
jgi:hypothetical protein